jgi:spore maturation protein CgeB
MHLQYRSEGITNGIYTPFGYNEEVYVRKDLPLKYEVSFVGGFSSYRRWVVGRLRKAGLDVHVFGRGWEGDAKWISTPEMVDVFNQSAVNLNLSNGISYDVRHLLHALTSPRAARQVMVNRKTKEQVKGRHYEINGCGGFQLSYFVPGLNLAYEIDREIAVFEDPLLLAEQVKFFLKDDALRREIALNGYNRSIREHTSKRRLSEMYAAIMQMP